MYFTLSEKKCKASRHETRTIYFPSYGFVATKPKNRISVHGVFVPKKREEKKKRKDHCACRNSKRLDSFSFRRKKKKSSSNDLIPYSMTRD